MHRRSYLALVAAGLAGCTGGGDTSTPTESATATPTRTATPTATPTPTPTPTSVSEPSIETVSLVSGYTEFGDAAENEIDAIGAGAPAIIAYQFGAAVHDGQLDVTEQVRIREKSSGRRIAMTEHTSDQLVDATGYQTWENAQLIDDARSWDRGEYEAEVIARDNAMGANSSPATASFSVMAPLGPGGARIASVDAPDTVSTGERYDYALALENTGGRDGSVVSSLSARHETADQWQTTEDLTVVETLGQGDTGTWAGYYTGFSSPGTVVMRLDAIDETWRVDVVE